MPTQLEVVNMAFDELGESIVASLAGTEDRTLCAMRQWDRTFRAFLRDGQWSFAKRTDTLSRQVTLTNGAFVMPAVDATVNVTMDSTAALRAGDTVIIAEVNEMLVSSITSATVAVLENTGGDENVDPGENVANDSIVWRTPAFGWGYAFVLPTGYVSPVALNELTVRYPSDVFEIERGYLLTDEETAYLEYIFEPADADLDTFLGTMDAQAVDALVLLLASMIAPKIVRDGGAMSDRLRQKYQVIVSRARAQDGNARHSYVREWANESTWVRARTGDIQG